MEAYTSAHPNTKTSIPQNEDFLCDLHVVPEEEKKINCRQLKKEYVDAIYLLPPRLQGSCERNLNL